MIRFALLHCCSVLCAAYLLMRAVVKRKQRRACLLDSPVQSVKRWTVLLLFVFKSTNLKRKMCWSDSMKIFLCQWRLACIWLPSECVVFLSVVRLSSGVYRFRVGICSVMGFMAHHPCTFWHPGPASHQTDRSRLSNGLANVGQTQQECCNSWLSLALLVNGFLQRELQCMKSFINNKKK